MSGGNAPAIPAIRDAGAGGPCFKTCLSNTGRAWLKTKMMVDWDTVYWWAWHVRNSGCHTQEPRRNREGRFLCSLSMVVNMVLSWVRWSSVFCVWRKHHRGALQHQGRGSCSCTYNLCRWSSPKPHLTLRRHITVIGLADHWEDHRCDELSSSFTE